jgi:hypothetical protein
MHIGGIGRRRAGLVGMQLAVASMVVGSFAWGRAAGAARPPDERLDQKVTFEAVGEPLEVILGRLSQLTGVSFRFEGRSVGDRKAIVIVRGVTLKAMQEAIPETFFGYRWREQKSKSDRQVEYVLYQDLRSRQIEDTLESSIDQEALGRLRQLLAGLHNGVTGLDQEAQHLIRDPSTRSVLQAFDRLSPDQIQMLWTNDSLPSSLRADDLTPEEQAFWALHVGAQVESVRRRASGLPEVRDFSEAKPLRLQDLPDYEFRVMFWKHEDGHSIIRLYLTSSVVANQAPGLSLANAWIPLSKPTMEDASKIPDVKNFLTGNSVHGAEVQDPDLARRVRPLTAEEEHVLKAPPYNLLYGPFWARWLVPFARRTGISVVSDFYTENYNMPPKDPTNRSVREALDEGCRAYKCRWSKCGPLYSFRHEAWYLLVPAEPPQRVIDALRTACDQKGRLNFDDLAIGGELNRQQLIRAEILKMPYDEVFRDNYPIVRLLNSLSTVERRMAQTTGLSTGTFHSLAAQPWFWMAASQAYPELESSEKSQLRLLLQPRVDARNVLHIAVEWMSPTRGKRADEIRLEPQAERSK